MSSSAASTARPTSALHLQLQPIMLLGILLVAAALRFYALEGSSLWSDEGNTWVLVQRSFTTIARDAAADIHPPGYYWLLKIWATLFGNSAAALRAFSALAGVLLVGVVYAIGRRFDCGPTIAFQFYWPPRDLAISGTGAHFYAHSNSPLALSSAILWRTWQSCSSLHPGCPLPSAAS